ncbi:MAG: VapC toxin family PIN domain ribonuclease [Verrucomicrobia bacterium]|nr:VapC toxin family PIN domain ribonuclease [Verrucomicrobiota bacterium]
MAKFMLIDTDVMVDFLRGHPKAVALVQSHSSRIILSSIVVAELYAGIRGPDELKTLDRLISLFRVIPVSPSLARAAGLYKKEYGKSHGIGLADAIIAATADTEEAALGTLNIKHYPMIKDLSPAYIKS